MDRRCLMERKSSWQHNLKRERLLRGWSQEDVAARIGSDPKTVGRWERGLTFPGPYFQQRLVDLFGKDAEALGFITKQEESLSHAPTDSYHHLSNQDSAEVLHIDDGEGLVTVVWPPNLPDESYYPLPGRERDLHNLLAVLQDPQGALIITIDGLGGLGKTALAVELTRRALHQRLFKGVIGDSAKHELFAGGEIVKVNEATLDFDALLDTIARQCGRWELTTLPRQEKRAMIAQLLQQQCYLVLVDNLETAENADALVSHLRNLLGVSRAIVTSRKQVRHDFVQAHALRELTQEDALFFLRKDLELRRVEQLMHASEEKLVEIHRVTGGAPLALKLVVSQARFLDLDVILRRLSNAGSKLYSFIYRQSWEQLSLIAQKILIYIGRTVVTTIGWEELATVGMEIAESEEQLLASIDELVAYSLLEVSLAANRVRYSTHQLTRQFVNSELPELWREQGLL
jgi:transcriptional regulator with XRE-family HTH domain